MELSCPKCLQIISTSFCDHFRSYCLQKTSLVKASDKVASFQDQTYVCARCLNIFTKDKWQYHQKKIRTQCSGYITSYLNTFTPTKNSAHDDEVSQRVPNSSNQKKILTNDKLFQGERFSVSQSRLFSSSLFSQRHTQSQRIAYTKQINQDQTILLLLLNLLDAKSKIPLLDWVKRNKKIKSIYLQQFFQKFLQKTFRRLWEVIKVPSFQMLEQRASMKWKQFLKQPDDIFNRQIVMDSVKNLSSSKRNKILYSLNRLYKIVYADIFPKFDIQVSEPKNKRVQLPLRTKDLFKILQQLFATNERDLVHIGIDLYLLFQSAQRITSDKLNIIKGIQQLMLDRKSDPLLCYLQMQIRKTGKNGKFILSQQLCQILQDFGWVGFYLKGRLYQRMRPIFGFPVYSIKKCIFSELLLQKAKEANINLQNLANHSTLKVSMNYAKDAAQINQKVIKDYLRIPNLRICPIQRENLYQFLGKRLHFKKHCRVNHDWLQKLRQKLNHYNKNYCDYYTSTATDRNGNIQFEQSQQVVKDKRFLLQNELVSKQNKNQQSRQQSLDQDKLNSEKVQLGGLQYSFKDNKFNHQQLFNDSSITYCQECDLEFSQQIEGGKICILCNANYHFKCRPHFCTCIKIRQYFPEKGVPYIHERQQNVINLLMPIEYLDNRNQKFLDQIIFLIAARRYRFANTAFYQGSLNISEEMIKKNYADKLVLSNFEDSQQGRYFPPLLLGLSGQKTTSGSGFGLFAGLDIPKNCFIGEYAADIMNGIDGIYIKRIDCVFNLIQGRRPSDTIILAPFKHCGYISLINGSTQQQANCSSKRVEINGFLRIIIFTHKKIKRGTQLCFNYSQESIFTKSFLSKKLSLQQKDEDQMAYAKRCGLVNLGQSCYINSTLQFLRILLGDKILETQQSIIEQMLYEIFLQMNCKHQYNPEFYIKQILREVNQHIQKDVNHFSIVKQADSEQFLLQLLNRTSRTILDNVFGTYISTLKCDKCGVTRTKQQSFLTLQKQIISDNCISDILRFPIAQYVECFCETCDNNRHEKTTQILKWPQILIVCLKRWKQGLSKNQSAVSISEVIKGYKLKAVIIHQGESMHKGHYIVEQYFQDYICVLDDQKVQFIKLLLNKSKGYIFGLIKNENQ